MDYYQKVLWSEGMFLVPQHFQQWDRYFENLIHQRTRALQPLGWGVSSLQIREEALVGGEFSVARCSAILPDGLLVDVPDLDEAPAARPVGPHFESKKDRLGVYLGIPVAKPGTALCAADGSASDRPTRYQKRLVTVNDANTGAGEREITAARKSLRILFEGEAQDDYTTLKIAELIRTATGAFALGEGYVPPCLYVSASPHLQTILRRILEILSSKSSELSKQRRQRSQGLVEFTMSEAANFWFLHTVNAYIPALMHYFNRSQVHPEAVYLELARLAGELYTFAGEGHPKDVPAYAHEDPASTFIGLEETIRKLMETVIPTRCVPIALEKTRESLYTGRVPDEQMLEKAQFYIAVMAGVPEEKIVREVPLKAKVSSLDRVPQLITQALRGMPVKHLATLPAEIPAQPGRTYFHLQKMGEHWDAVRASRTMSIFIPPEFTGLKLELMAVKE
ncbi:MAG: type VI secretion system baseplate subunit TssK [Planctomycetes bacterium]|nr:type VI secretion system baseplate subunit TssK [Planctomycetota bacterium]